MSLRFVPPCCHWYDNGGVPVALTAKFTVPPAHRFVLAGCCVMAGGNTGFTTIQFNCVLTLEPSGPLTVKIIVFVPGVVY